MRLLVRWLTRLLLMTDVDEFTKIVSLTYTFHNEEEEENPPLPLGMTNTCWLDDVTLFCCWRT